MPAIDTPPSAASLVTRRSPFGATPVSHQWLSPALSPDDRRLVFGLLISFVFHGLLLSLVVSGQGPGLPGFGLPWQVRRMEVPELSARLVPVQVEDVQPRQEPSIERPPDQGLQMLPAQTSARVRGESATGSVRVERPEDKATAPLPKVAVIAVAQSDQATFAVPAEPEVPTPVVATSPSGPSAPVVVPAPPQAVEGPVPPPPDADKPERDTQEALRQAQRLEAEKQALARQAATRQEAARQEAAQLEVARVEAARVEAERHEAARQLAAKQEAARRDAERHEATRQAAIREEAARQEANRAQAARAEAARLAATPTEEEKREARLRAIGRQLNEEADRRDAAEAAARRSPSASGLRRGRLFGHTDPQAELVLYAEAWSRKIQLNMTFDMVREAARQAHARPLVTVAIRSDGSVESVAFVSTSGVPAIDEAIRRIVQSQAPYPAFPPGLLREYDVIEIRRTWHFDMAIRLY